MCSSNTTVCIVQWTNRVCDHTLIKNKIKCSSYIRKFRREQLQSHIWTKASSYMTEYTLWKLWTLNSVHIIGWRKTKLSSERNMFPVSGLQKNSWISVVFRFFRNYPKIFRSFLGIFRSLFRWKLKEKMQLAGSNSCPQDN